jgi:cytochrome c-type biogenesis protein CcmH/NrfF
VDSWLVFGIILAVVVIGGIVLWRRWRRWNPVQGTSDEAKAAEARLWSTRQGDQTGGL